MGARERNRPGRRWRTRLALLALLLSAPMAGAAGAGAAGAGAAGAGEAAPVEVYLDDNFYAPARIELHPGMSVLFTNRGRQLHAVTLIGHEDLLDEGYLEPGESLAFELAGELAPGTYTLGCNIHLAMTAEIVVLP